MDTVSIALCCFLVFLISRVFLSSKSRGQLPPGPRGLPIIGSVLSLAGKYEHLVFSQWRQEYGELVYFSTGVQKILLLNSHKAMKAAFSDQADIFSGRIKAKYLQKLAHDAGIILNDGPIWKEHRRFVLHALRDFGFGRSVSEEIIDSECENLLKRLNDIAGKPSAPRSIMSQTINNVIARLTFGERTGVEDSKFDELIHHIDVVTNQITFASLLPVVFPFIMKIPPLLNLIERITPLKAALDFSHDLIRTKINEHIKDLGPDIASMDSSQAKDLCDSLLIEQARLEKEGVKHSFSEWQILRNLLELFLAGTDTTSTTLVWTFFFLGTNPEAQRCLQEELDREVGLSRRPRMKDRPNLHYACAVMDEILRCSSLARSGAPRRTTEETELLGYTIPANTTVMPNIYLIHHDPELWERPEEFWPGHFLDEKGHYKPSPYLCPFSIGKRACLGESLARMEIFMFMTGIMQSFNVRLADPNADVAAINKGTRGNFRRPNPHEVILDRRTVS